MHISHIGATEREYHSLERRCRTNWVTCRFVFDNYTWSDNGGPWTYNGDKIVPAHIPLSALIQGRYAGPFSTFPGIC